MPTERKVVLLSNCPECGHDMHLDHKDHPVTYKGHTRPFAMRGWYIASRAAKASLTGVDIGEWEAALAALKAEVDGGEP